ncbi:integrase core domain-containing protein [Glutamicibacter protophormiae]|uniref:integrase core domain-containing protein n=1 Tax=Glutamicibacter protophormiae TaxID=37930 RepID=UPI00195685A2|nr:integrase core domain-containing protein [Glutamicibacter protophormiae]QRQ78326.1 transposase family protein [Glutamicibacter protophormiae]
MPNALSPRLRAMIISFDPTQPEALTISEFCKTQKISRSIFYRIRERATQESAGALHPRSRAPREPSRRYGPEVINELVRIRKELKKDGWDYGPKTIHYEATIQDDFPGGQIPSVATIARLLACVGHVERSPRKRPKSSYVPFVRSTAMALWQLDAFEFRTLSDQVVTVYQLIDDATRFDVGSSAYARHENSGDAQQVLAQAINAYGPPKEVLSDNSKAFNQLRGGTIGIVEAYLASQGSMPITGLPGRPTTQGKNERSHQTLQRFLKANKPQNLADVQRLLRRYREHYNQRRPHQSLNQATPQKAWELLEHTPATEPIPMVVLEAKAAEYLMKRRVGSSAVNRADLVVSKTGDILDKLTEQHEPAMDRESHQLLVRVNRDNCQAYYRGKQISLPQTYADRQFLRTITDDEFILSDPDTAEVVLSFPLPLVALRVHQRFVASYSIRGIHLAHPTKQWSRKAAECQAQYEAREEDMPEVFDYR